MTIVYTSKTGFTREYAQMLGRAAGLPVCALDEATGKVGPGSDILYLGWLMAGHISGIDHAVKRFHVRAACGVGMTPPGDKVLQDLARSNYVPNAPIFYLQGGWAPKKVGWLQRRMVGMATGGCGSPSSRSGSGPLRNSGSWICCSAGAAAWPSGI